MTRDEMIEVLRDLAAGPGDCHPFWGLKPADHAFAVVFAPLDWALNDAEWADLPVVLDIVTNPPAWASDPIWQTDWQSAVGNVMDGYATRDHGGFLEVAMPFAEVPSVGRQHIIGAAYCLAPDLRTLPWLTSLSGRDDLSEDDFVQLADGFHALGGMEREALLRGLRARVPEAMGKAIAWIDKWLAGDLPAGDERKKSDDAGEP